jgi:hypothetical protein
MNPWRHCLACRSKTVLLVPDCQVLVRPTFPPLSLSLPSVASHSHGGLHSSSSPISAVPWGKPPPISQPLPSAAHTCLLLPDDGSPELGRRGKSVARKPGSGQCGPFLEPCRLSIRALSPFVESSPGTAYNSLLLDDPPMGSMAERGESGEPMAFIVGPLGEPS